MPKPKKRRRQSEEPLAETQPRVTGGHHIHLHELHGYEQARHLRRPFRIALGYVPREP